jgi:hypothetical protein
VSLRLRASSVHAFGKPHFEGIQEQRLLTYAREHFLDVGPFTHEWGEGLLVSSAYAWPTA